jgi:shikimate dehydrogenase
VPRLAVIGYPVGHSRSPAMQSAALEALGLAGEWSYKAIEVAPEDFEATVREMAKPGGYTGVNVTVPHKEAAFALADEADWEAKRIGAANTLTFESGAIQADNTDIPGLRAVLPSDPADAHALVLGAGGAARAAIWAVSGVGGKVEVWNRNDLRAEEVCAQVGGKPVEDPSQEDYDLIVNTTTVGLHGEDPFTELPLSREDFNAEQTVVDMVYGERPSSLLEAAAALGASTVDGIEILVQQGARSLAIWTGKEPPIDTMRAAARL